MASTDNPNRFVALHSCGGYHDQRFDCPNPQWRCSGDGPATHNECDFTTDSFTAAMDHFEATGHAVDECV